MLGQVRTLDYAPRVGPSRAAASQVRRRSEAFSDFISHAIEQQGSLAELARRWVVSEETIRGWRENGTTPNLGRIISQINFNTDERMELCRMISRGQFMVEPYPAEHAELDAAAVAIAIDVHQNTNELIGAAVNVQRQIIAATADGKIDDTERQCIEQANDNVIQATRRTRPGFFSKWLKRMR